LNKIPVMHKDPGKAGPLCGHEILDCVFKGFEGTGLDDFAGGLGFEDGWLFCEWIDTFTFGHGGLRDCSQFHQAWKHNFIFCFEFFVHNIAERIQDGIDLFLLQSALTRNCFDQLSLTHTF